jgi:hypothetical protein
VGQILGQARVHAAPFHHPVTRDGKATEVLVVGAGKLLVYVYDLPAGVRGRGPRRRRSLQLMSRLMPRRAGLQNFRDSSEQVS